MSWLCTHAKGMPMLYRVWATSRLTRRARQQKTTWGVQGAGGSVGEWVCMRAGWRAAGVGAGG
jgi:hypothetical protein